jgi:hypothetical protein
VITGDQARVSSAAGLGATRARRSVDAAAEVAHPTAMVMPAKNRDFRPLPRARRSPRGRSTAACTPLRRGWFSWRLVDQGATRALATKAPYLTGIFAGSG